MHIVFFFGIIWKMINVFSSCFIVSTWSRFKTDLSNCLFEVSLKMTSVYFRCQLLYSYELWDETTGVCPLLWQRFYRFSKPLTNQTLLTFSFLCVFGSGTKVGWSHIRIFSDLLIIYDMVIVISMSQEYRNRTVYHRFSLSFCSFSPIFFL